MKTSKVLSVIPVAAVVLLMSCSGNKVQEQTVEEKVKVKLETVHMQEVDQIAEFTASVEANISNMIAPQAPARIGKLHVEVGDRVRAGQLLATMDETQLRQTQIQLENLETEFKRIDELFKVGGVSQSAWEGQKMALDLQKTALKNLEENNKLVSPISGIVTARNYDNGDMYSGAQPVYTVEQINPVKLMVNVSESYFTQVAKGKEVDIRLDVYGEEVFKGQVNLVYPTIDPLTRTFQVEIKLNNNDQRVRPGMFARVVMHFGAKEHVVIPDQAVVKQAGSGDRYVYIYKNGKVSYDKIELGRRMDNRYEVISGVQDGDQVVTTAQNRLTNGMEVDIVK
ncbi:RND family efflux transporter MFP subunit [Parabacteroides sp. PFB2-12]|uniref:efflux RND transporter periplasmic adaptor subunit n=1 Tax=unclassified Parabacteroides TaxID=2649774 RepID=UPI0024746EA8|nr:MULTISPECIES: efflux RND transporter periplasmic adaptor subunit [unclassified Parabacteroides]MDH6343458.1 RND family efflux transporter MFP subunit [Parabacteroides sp. PM6-13]MDH6390942.1 RND family efflux transporter MFP subunit [Parabacteroides sp. PFB2-12]